MEKEGSWRVFFNEHGDENSRLIFSGYKHRHLIDITIQSQSVDHIVNAVLSSNWNAEQVMDFLNFESERIHQGNSLR